MLVFNHLLEAEKIEGEKIEPEGVLVLRHTPSERDGRLREELPWLAAVRPDGQVRGLLDIFIGVASFESCILRPTWASYS